MCARPLKNEEEKATVRRTIRLTSEEDSLIANNAHAAGCSFSKYVRRMALGEPQFTVVDTDEVRKIRRQIRYDSNNLNQLTRALNALLLTNDRNDSKVSKALDLLEQFKAERKANKANDKIYGELIDRLEGR